MTQVGGGVNKLLHIGGGGISPQGHSGALGALGLAPEGGGQRRSAGEWAAGEWRPCSARQPPACKLMALYF